MRRSSSVPLGTSYLALATLAASAGLVAACGNRNDNDNQVYCGDENGILVDDDDCDDDDGRHFFYAGHYGKGRKPGYKLVGGTKISPSDSAARTRAGLPATGKVSNGTVVKGGFGSSGSSGKGSSGGKSSGG